MESEESQSNLVIVTNKGRFTRFLKMYAKAIIFITMPIFLAPIAIIGHNNAYPSFYIFLVTEIYWIADILHPGVISLIPVGLFTIMGAFDRKIVNAIKIRNTTLDSFGIMMIILAIENSLIHKRIAVKILLIFGCSHFRLSFLLFFSTMLLSMWFTNTMACGFMMPIVKAILMELEKMGILETHEMTVATHSNNSDVKGPRPTDFTIFYFLGIAYSSTIGGMSTLIGSETNQILKNYCAMLFPESPTLEAPHFMLLTLPGVLIMGMFLYLWLNFYFLGMLRVQNYTALQATLTDDEEQYITMLLKMQYQQLGKIKFQEMAVSALVILTGIFQIIISANNLNDKQIGYSVIKLSAPSLVSAVILFMLPVNLDWLKFLSRRNDNNEPLPSSPSRGCLTWSLLKDNIQWSVLLVIASSDITFEALKEAKMTDEFEKFLSMFSHLPAPVLALVVIVFCKVLAECASNASVAYCLLIHIARVSVKAKVNPLYIMMSATLSTSSTFHLRMGTPPNALVASYVNIPQRKMMIAGIGPTIISIFTNLFTVSLWSRAIWPDIGMFPKWIEVKKFQE